MNKLIIVAILIVVILLGIVLYLLYNNSENGLSGMNLKSLFKKNNKNIDIDNNEDDELENEEIQNKTYKNLKKYKKSNKYIPPVDF